MAANDSGHKRGLSKKNERVLIIDYIRLPSLNSLIYSSCLALRWMYKSHEADGEMRAKGRHGWKNK